MDPLSALSIACNVIQVVDFGLKTVSTFWQIYNNKGEYGELEKVSQDLGPASNDLEASLIDATTTQSLTRDDAALLDLAKECGSTAQEIESEIEKLRMSSGAGNRATEAIVKTFRSLRKKKAFEELEQKLNRYRHALDTRLLIDLRKRALLLASQDKQAFEDLARQFGSLQVMISHGKADFESLTRTLHQKTLNHTTAMFRELKVDQDSTRDTKRLLDSLSFPEMNVRQEQVSDAHRTTFEWIWNPLDPEAGEFDDLDAWLRHGNGIFWIKGKPGSGKSTLMNYLDQDERLEAGL